MKQNPEKQKRLLLAMAVVCLLSVAVLAVVWVRTRNTGFTPPPFEAAAVDGTPAPDTTARAYGVVDAQAYKVALCAVPEVKDGAADICFTNPAENEVWIKVQLYDADGNLLGESGLLKPGQYVEKVSLNKIPRDGAAVMLRVVGYEPETYHSAGTFGLNTTFSVP